jgi:hypothetical protein
MACGIHQLPFALKTHDQGSVVLGRCSSLSMGVFRMKKLILMCVLLSGCANMQPMTPEERMFLQQSLFGQKPQHRSVYVEPVRIRQPINCMPLYGTGGFTCQ